MGSNVSDLLAYTPCGLCCSPKTVSKYFCLLDPLSPNAPLFCRGSCCAPGIFKCWTEFFFQKTFKYVDEKLDKPRKRWTLDDNKDASKYWCTSISVLLGLTNNPFAMEWCETRRLGTDIFLCFRCLPCCTPRPMRNILILGRKGCGKTTLLKTMFLSSRSLSGEGGKRKGDEEKGDQTKELGELFTTVPTMGLNNEKVTFNVWQVMEAYDVGGSVVQRRELWRSVYRPVGIDSVIYVIDVSSFVSSNEDPQTLEADRKELHKLLAESELRTCDFFVYLTFKSVDVDDDQKNDIMENVREALGLPPNRELRRVLTYVEYEILVLELGVDPNISPGLISNIA
ncbi:hypothetical protein AAMO2058_001583400 [Amorphochlora amoebiformis]